MNRVDTILELQKISRLNISKDNFINHKIIYKLISPFVYESHRERLSKGKYIFEFTYTGLNIRVIDDLSILLTDCVKTLEGYTYICYDWKDLKNSDIAELIDLVIDENNRINEIKNAEQCLTEEKEYEYEIRIYKSNDLNNNFIAEVPELKNCFAGGKTYEEALKNIKEHIKCCIALDITKENIESSEEIDTKPILEEIENKSQIPKTALAHIKENINNNVYSAIQVLLSEEEIKEKINELGFDSLNYKV